MMKLKIVIGFYFLLNSMNLYAERAKECMKYWNEPAVQVKVLKDVECPDIWDESFNKGNKKLVKAMGLNLKDKNWMSTGTCNHVEYKNKEYYIYWADIKNTKTDIIIIYDDKNSFAYSREIDRFKIKDGLKEDEVVDVLLSCGKNGVDKNIVSALNGYIFKETSIRNIFKYKIYDRFK